MSEVVGVEKAATRTQAVDGPTWAVCGEREAGHCTCQRSILCGAGLPSGRVCWRLLIVLSLACMPVVVTD